MKLRATVLGALLILLFAVTTAEAYTVMDAPHNFDSSGMYCFHCHSPDPQTGADYWFNPLPVYGQPGFYPDISVSNWVCNRCHGAPGIRTIEARPGGNRLIGPEKKTHSSTSTDSSKPAWATDCVDCHDPHFQAQKDYGSSAKDGDKAFIAVGTFDTLPEVTKYIRQPGDVFIPEDKPTTGLGGPNGTTRIRINVTRFDKDPSTWINKGKPQINGVDFQERAQDGTRGLTMVVDKADPVHSRTFEIVKVEPDTGQFYYVTLNGDAYFNADGSFPMIGASQEFGVLYGASVRDYISTSFGPRQVKFFTDEKVLAGDPLRAGEGGMVDLTGNTLPTGVCQVCHSGAVYFKNDQVETVHHDADPDKCVDCHDVLEGAAATLVDHDVIIHDGNNCSLTCHIGYDTEAGVAHIGTPPENGCQTCHQSFAVNPAPWLSEAGSTNNVMARVIPWVNGPGDHTADWPTFTCLNCHSVAAGKGDYTSGHPVVDLDVAHTGKLLSPPSFCTNLCHGSLNTGSTPADIVSNTYSHNSDCSKCHVTVIPTQPYYDTVELWPAAEAGRTGADCQGCHTTHFNGHDHGVINADDGGLAEHTITNVAPCDGCHDAVAGGDAPDAIKAPFVGFGEVHATGCLTCHSSVDGAPFGSAINGWGADWSTPPATTDCTGCHGDYFNLHTHHTTAKNQVQFNGSAGNDQTTSLQPCSTCHQDIGNGTASLDDWAGVIKEHETKAGVPIGGPGCPVCHSYTNADAQDTPTVSAVNTAIQNVAEATINCGTCHTVKTSVDHGGHIAGHFGWAGDCADCHSANPGAPTEEVVLDIHNDVCTLCHFDPDNVITPGNAADNYDRKVAYDGDATEAIDKTATCLTCHVTATPLINKPFIHHENNGSIVYDPLTTCTNCHNSANNSISNHNADHIAGTSPGFGMVKDTTDNSSIMQKECSSCHDAYNAINITSPADGNNVPVDVTPTPGNKIHDACTTCHQIESVTNIVKLVPIGAIATAMPDGGTPNGGTDGGGTCKACHTGYFDAHTHHDNVGLNRLAINDNPDADPTWRDVSWGNYWSCGTNTGSTGCHQDWESGGGAPAGTALDTWAGVRYEHDRVNTPTGNVKDVDGQNSCANCHYDNLRSGASVNSAKFVGASTVKDIVEFTPKTDTNCTDCHLDKKAPNVHGLTYIDHFEINTTSQGTLNAPPILDNPECGTCHTYDISGIADPAQGGSDLEDDTTDIIIGLHRNSCVLCHVSQPDLLNDPGKRFDLYAVSGGVYCVQCHQNATDYDGLPKKFHGMTADNIQTRLRHDNFGDSDVFTFTDTTGTKLDCLACHTEMFDSAPTTLTQQKLARHMIPNNCETCHAMQGSQSATIINNGMGAGGTNQPCENCHTATGIYRLHAMNDVDAQNTLPTAVHNNLGVDATCNTGCHGDLSTEAARLGVHNGAHGTGPVGLKGGCQECHTAADFNLTWKSKAVIDSGRSPVFNGVSTGGDLGKTCVSCHDETAGSYLMHGMGNSNVEGAHNRLAGSTGTGNTDCEQCHIGVGATAFEKRLDLHPSCETCHTLASPASPADTSIAYGIAETGDVNCEMCHAAQNTYKLHGMNNTDVALAHNNIGTDLAGDTACYNCHPYTTQEDKLNVHVTNGCLGCHGSLVGNPAAQAITDGRAVIDGGTDTMQDCDMCHTGVGIHKMHGLTNSEMDSASGHDKLGISNGTDDTDCGQCHASTTQTARAALHPGCFTGSCHAAGAPATTVITNGIGGIDQKCEFCHTGTGAFTLHPMLQADIGPQHDQITISGGTFTGNDDCAVCHTMGTFTEKIALHVTNGCTGCHTSAVQKVKDAITNGTSLNGGSNIPQTCSSCHTVQGDSLLHGLTEATVTGAQTTGTHENFVSNTVVNSDCKGCHLPDSEIGRLQVHSAVLPNNCRGCHDLAVTDPDTLLAITTGVGGTDVTCADCHKGNSMSDIWTSWYNHADPDHTSGNLTVLKDSVATGTPNIDNCESCHDAGSTLTQVEIHNGCSSCHHTDGSLKTLGNGFPSASTNNYTTGEFECNQCHVGYPTNHTHHTNPLTNQLIFDNSVDLSQAASTPIDAGNECAACHLDDTDVSGVPLSSFTDIFGEHKNECSKCHSYDETVDGLLTPSEAEIAAAIAILPVGEPPTVMVTCVDCHVKKDYLAGASSNHGGHDATHFPWEGATPTSGDRNTCGGAGVAGKCHDSEVKTNVVSQVHIGPYQRGEGFFAGQTTTCENCHNQPSSTTGGDGNTGPGLNGRGTAEITDNAGPASPLSTGHVEKCTTCHTPVTLTFFEEHSVIDHSTWVSSLAGCTDTCHSGTAYDGTNVPVNPATPAGDKVHDSCLTCHSSSTGLLLSFAAADIRGIISAMPAGGGDCTACHGASYFDSHTHHDNAATNQVAFDVAIDLSQDTAKTACNACHPDTSTPNAFGTLATPTWSGILAEHNTQGDGGIGCNTCHDAGALADQSGAAGTPNDTTVATRITTDAISKCTDCHTAKLWSAGASSTHGGHAPGSFDWTAGTIASCGTGAGAGCHSGDVVSVVHMGSYGTAYPDNTCVNCHNDGPTNGGGLPAPGGGDDTTGVGPRGIGSAEITANGGPASATVHTEDCTVCHTTGMGLTKGQIHHAGTDATGGNCIKCHEPDVGQFGVPAKDTRAELVMPSNLACNYCHLYWPNGAYNGTPRNIYKLVWDPNGTTVNTRATATPLTTHAISTATPPINDYAACFACHGNTAYVGSNGTSTKVVPFHGNGDTTTSAGADVYVGDATCYGAYTDGTTSCGGLAGDTINIYFGPDQIGSGNTAAMTDNRNPGALAFNLLLTELRMEDSGGSNGGNNVYGTGSKWKKIHNGDHGKAVGDALYPTTFAVPWDNFAATTPAAPQTVTIWGGYNHSNHTDTKESHTVSTNMPTVPITLP